jgi:HEAT repeat protein
MDFASGDVKTAYDRHNVRQLMSLAASAEKPVRLDALQALTALADPQALPFLIKQLDDLDADVVEAAVWAMPNLGSAAASDSLARLQALSEAPGRSSLRQAIGCVIGDLQDPAHYQSMRAELIARDPDQRKEAVAFFVQKGDLSVMPYARQLLNASDPVQRQTAVLLLHGLDDRASEPAFQKLLQDPVATVRAAAVLAVGDWKEAGGFELLQPSLKDPDPLVRASAVAALGNNQNPEISSALAALAKDTTPTVRLALTHALAKFASPAASEALLSLAMDDNASVREPAVDDLVAFHDPTVNEKMQRYLVDKESRRHRRAALRYFASESLKTPAATFLPLVHDPDSQIRLGAIKAILARPDVPTQIQLVYLLDDPNPDIRQAILGHVTTFLQEPRLNRQVLKQKLLRLQDDSNPNIRVSAQRALAQL